MTTADERLMLVHVSSTERTLKMTHHPDTTDWREIEVFTILIPFFCTATAQQPQEPGVSLNPPFFPLLIIFDRLVCTHERLTVCQEDFFLICSKLRFQLLRDTCIINFKQPLLMNYHTMLSLSETSGSLACFGTKHGWVLQLHWNIVFCPCDVHVWLTGRAAEEKWNVSMSKCCTGSWNVIEVIMALGGACRNSRYTDSLRTLQQWICPSVLHNYRLRRVWHFFSEPL